MCVTLVYVGHGPSSELSLFPAVVAEIKYVFPLNIFDKNKTFMFGPRILNLPKFLK